MATISPAVGFLVLMLPPKGPALLPETIDKLTGGIMRGSTRYNILLIIASYLKGAELVIRKGV